MSDKNEITALAIQIRGEIVSSNFEEFKARAMEKIGSMDYELLTDGDFEKAKADVKSLEVAAKALKATKEDMLRQLDDVYELMGGIDEIIAAADKCRLGKAREIKRRDAEVREKIIGSALELIDHPQRGKFRAEVTEGTKRKRTFATMEVGANKVAAKINAEILKTREVLEQFEGEHGTLLIPDRSELELKDAEAVASELRHRLEKKRDEDEKARLKAEAEAARKEAEAAKAPEPEPLPEPRRVDTIPVGGGKPAPAPEGETAAQEMERFLSTVTSAFAPVKEARAQLKHPENIEAAGGFARELGEAWANFKSKLP